MANGQPRGGSLFSGLILIIVGIIFLLHYYRGIALGTLFGHWWPLLLIMWGLIKLYERTIGNRAEGTPSAWVTGREIALVLCIFALVGVVVVWDIVKGEFHDKMPDFGDEHEFSLNVAPKSVPADARIVVRVPRGDITVRPSDDPEISVSAKKSVRSWSEKDAEHIAGDGSVEIAQNGDAWEVRPAGADLDSRVAVNMEVSVPSKSAVTVRNDKGEIQVSDLGKDVTIAAGNGDIEVRDIKGDVSIDAKHGDIKVSDTKGNVKISGTGGEVEVVDASGGLTLNGEFLGPIRADRVLKGVRFVSKRTDLTLTQLTGHLETGSGNLEITDAPGNLVLKTNSYDVSIENAGGKVKVENRNGSVDVRFPTSPKEDIEIVNASANITLSLPSSSSFEIQADCHSCDVESEFEGGSLKGSKSQSGDGHLEGKYGSGRPVKILLKTSYGAIAIRKTS